MNRNEFLEALPLSRLTVKLIGATLEICTDDIDDIHVMVSGADRDVSALKIVVSGDQLLVEQPALSIAKNPVATSWMQITLRLPRSWKGRIEGRTVSGWINARSLAGSDIALDTVSGLIIATGLDFITVSAKSVTGDVKISGLVCEKATLGSTSGDVTVQSGRISTCSLTNITGNTTLSLLSAFQRITATSVTGDLAIDAPIDVCNAVLRSVAGRIRTCGVSILEDAPASVHFSSVSGVLDMTWTEGQ